MCLDSCLQEKCNTRSHLAIIQAYDSDTLLGRVFCFIETNIHRPVSLRDVAGAVGYSPAYLTDLVRRQTGQTINYWITEFRLAKACCLLLETDQTINQIAQAVGYQNVNYFFRQFRRSHGITPQVWRDTARIQHDNQQSKALGKDIP